MMTALVAADARQARRASILGRWFAALGRVAGRRVWIGDSCRASVLGDCQLLSACCRAAQGLGLQSIDIEASADRAGGASRRTDDERQALWHKTALTRWCCQPFWRIDGTQPWHVYGPVKLETMYSLTA
jgi:hypothetical protein